jgi:hypothetical protein
MGMLVLARVRAAGVELSQNRILEGRIVISDRKARALVLCIGALMLAGADPAASPSPAPTPVAAPVVTPMPPPEPNVSPVPTPVATPTVLMQPSDAPPQILWISLSSTAPRAGDTLAIVVLASSNVASVELRVGGYGSTMNKTDVGRFESSSQVPKLPFFMNHNVTLQVIARNTAGVATEQDIPISVR